MKLSGFLIISFCFYFLSTSSAYAGKDYVNEAKQAFTKNDFQTALTNLRKAYEEKEHRKSFEVNYLLAASFFALENTDSSIAYFIRSRELASTRAESILVYAGLGDSYNKKKIPIAAIEEYKKAIGVDSSLVDVYFKLAKLYRIQRDYNNAASAFQNVTKLDTMNLEALTALADIYTKAKQYTNAARMYKRLTALQPDDLEIHIMLMRSLVAARAAIEAIPIAETILAKDTNNSEARHILANAYYDSRKYPEAEKEFLHLQQNDSISTEEILRLAKSQTRNQKQVEAIATFEKYLASLTPDSSLVDVYVTLGELYMSNQRYDSAIATFQKRIRFDSSAISAYMNAGICKMQLKDFKGAIPFFQNVITRKPEYIKGHLYLARTYALMNDYPNEGDAYKKMVEAIGDSTEKYKTELAEAHGFDGFINFFNGSQKAKENPEEASKLYAKGVSSLKVALTFDSANVPNNLMLGQLYQNMNKVDEAIRQYRLVLKLDPKNTDAKKGLDALKDLEKKK